MTGNAKLILWVKIILVIFYLVGILGFSLDLTYDLFVALTPLNLSLTAVVLLYFQQQWSVKTALILILVACIGFVTEWIGINTGWLFGNYSYGPALGLKLMDTPLLIGINWLLLAYGVFVLFSKINQRWYFPFLGALLMVLFDFIMEPVATALKMWSWESATIPLKNYFDWYLVSLLIFALMRAGRVSLKNPLAVWILGTQLVFFLALTFTLNLI
ncbi:carotenoid biosynthesis protein [Sunxiuqinia elliptica]|uniref:Putative membrane protein n=1 Tax=Sunxiuqinia elliptica TaxID=655355 RepID=A0A1I2D4F4_9BACT|nr:carotenoid biosynthesis protein [Sunxiuqinia elliptica]SFE74850.1 putative membrane protein [Sunxiuqinia elliptica]